MGMEEGLGARGRPQKPQDRVGQKLQDPQRRQAVLSSRALGIQLFSASGRRCAVLNGEPHPAASPRQHPRVLRLFLKRGHSSASSSQAPFLGTREPSDLGWAGLGPAGTDFGSGVGFPEQIYGTGSVAKRQLSLPHGRGSGGVLVPEGHSDPKQAKPWWSHLPVKADPERPHCAPFASQALRLVGMVETQPAMQGFL